MRFLREIWWGSARIIYIQTLTIHPTIMYHQSFRKGSFFWGLLPGERGLVFWGGKGKCAFYVKFGGAVPGLYIYRH